MDALEEIIETGIDISGNWQRDGDIPEGLERDATALMFFQTCNYDTPTAEEERKLFELYEDAKANGSEELVKEYRDRIAGNCYKFVVKFARKYIGNGVPFADLCQEGNLGLLRAIERFDYKRGYRFCTYAGWWIRQVVERALPTQGRSVKLPIHANDAFNQVRKVMYTYREKHGKSPSPEYIRKETGCTIGTIDAALRWMHDTLSLDRPIEGEDEVTTFKDFIEDQNAESPLDYASRSALKDDLEEALQSLTPRKRRIIELRFGLIDGYSMTLDEVGEEIGLTRERIRQIQGEALARLRHPSRSRILNGYLD